MLAVSGHGVELAEPAARVVHADVVVAVPVRPVGDQLVMAHEPDHQLAARGHARVDVGRLDVGRLAFAVQVEADVGIGLRGGVHLAGAHGEVVGLRLRVVELRGGLGAEPGRERSEDERGQGRHGAESRGSVVLHGHLVSFPSTSFKACSTISFGAHWWPPSNSKIVIREPKAFFSLAALS